MHYHAKQMDLIGIGSFNLDYISERKLSSKVRSQLRLYFGDDIDSRREIFVDDATIDSILLDEGRNNFTVCSGGSAYNTVRTVESLGVGLNVGFIGVVGCDAQESMVKNFFEGIDTSFSVFVQGESPGRCIAYMKENNEKLITSPNINFKFTELIRKKENKDKGTIEPSNLVLYLSNARWIHISSFIDRGVLSFLAKRLRQAKQINPGLIVSFDPGDEYTENKSPEVLEIIELSNTIFLNAREFCNLANMPFTRKIDYVKNAKRILSTLHFEGEVFIVKGAFSNKFLYFDRNTNSIFEKRYWHQWRPHSMVANDIGAGDVFAGGVIGGMLHPVFDGFGEGPTRLATLLVKERISHDYAIPYEKFGGIVAKLKNRSMIRGKINLRNLVKAYHQQLLVFMSGIAIGLIANIIYGIIGSK